LLQNEYMAEEPKTETPVGLGTLLLIAVGGRLLFNSLLVALPSIEPVIPSAVLAGMLQGAASGAVVGFAGYFLSNLFLFSIGEWTIWQGFAGLIAGYIGSKTTRENFVTNTILATVIFELIINFYGAGYTVDSAYFFGSLGFSITHIASNAVFAVLFKIIWLKDTEEKEEKKDNEKKEEKK